MYMHLWDDKTVWGQGLRKTSNSKNHQGQKRSDLIWEEASSVINSLMNTNYFFPEWF